MYSADLYDKHGNYIKDQCDLYKDTTYRDIRVNSVIEGADAIKIESNRWTRYFIAIYNHTDSDMVFNSWVETSENRFYEHLEESRRVSHQNLLQSCQ